MLIIILIFTPILDIPFYLKAKPPGNVNTLNAYLKWKPETENIYKVEINGNIYYICCSKAGRLFASGPSVYCFDSNSNFVGWTKDIGDFQGSLPKAVYEKRYSWTKLNIEEVTKQGKR